MKLSTEKLKQLLDVHGISTTWKSLLKTLALNDYLHPASQHIVNHEDYAQALTLNENILHDLSIGEISALYEFSLSYTNPASRKNQGQYFTPDDAAEFIAQHSKQYPENSIWLDPCSGVGNLTYWLIQQQDNKEDFLLNYLYCVDLDPHALHIARSLFTLFFYQKEEQLYSLLAPRFINADFLITQMPPHDYSILNPPYVKTIADKQYETFEAKNVYAYFLEKTIKETKGFISVTPQSFTSSRNFHALRRLLLNKYSTIHIYCFDNTPDAFFKGIKFGSTNTNTENSTRAAVLVTRTGEKQDHKITPLLRWIRKEREQAFQQMDTLIAPSRHLTESKFVKNYASLNEFYDTTRKWKTLDTLLSPTPTPYKLYVNSIPRYYITASKKAVNRSAIHTLYFTDEDSMNTAYLVLNSSITYWWWKINDGGMDFYKYTLTSTPIPPSMKPSTDLISMLEGSEEVNGTSLFNAKKLTENIKHPLGLIHDINVHLLSIENTDNIIKLHANSDMI